LEIFGVSQAEAAAAPETATPSPAATPPELAVDLRDPALAAFLAWLWPGSGHLYQRRWGKGVLFMVCILGTFFYGLFIGNGRVVYASWREGDRRLPYLCQVGVGLPALPALVQAYRAKHGRYPLWGGVMAPPKLTPPEQLDPNDPAPETLSDLHLLQGQRFEIGTLFTMIAGLLNMLAIYDAWGGPVIMETEAPPGRRKEEEPPSGEGPAPPPPS
jgi:hypothetical protein